MDYTKDYLKQKRNKNLKGIFIGIGILLVALLGSTYAFFTYSKSLQAFTLTSSGVTAKFTSGTNEINIANAYPISDQFAISNLDKLSYIDFTVEGNIQNEDQGLTYEIYLTEKSGNTLDPNYIKVYITDENNNQVSSPKIYNSLDNTTYSKDASTGKVIYKLEGMPGNYSKNFRIYAWIDKDYSQNEVSQEFSFYVNLYAYNDTNKLGSDLIKKAALARANDGSNCLTTVEEDGITYISGSKTCIDFNYVWYSGKMWRITAIYPDGSMKLITENNITSIAFNNNTTYYDKTNGTKSYMFQWLNEDFLDTLYNHENIIDTTKYWNATMPANTTISTKPAETEATMIPSSTSPVGLLNNYEYYKSYQNTTNSSGYLNIGYYWCLLNPYNASSVLYVRGNGNGNYGSPTNTSGVRPSIYLKSDISFAGSGTKLDPFRITIDLDGASTNDLLNTRISGEYIKFKSDGNNDNYDAAALYRIVGTEGEGQNKTTKIVAMDFASYDNNGTVEYAKKFGASNNATGVTWGTCTSSDCWNYYLNDTNAETGKWYPNLTFKDKLVMGIYYLGQVPAGNRNYKLSVCNATNFDATKTIKECIQNGTIATTWNSGYVGILRYGEMFATRQKTGDVSLYFMWLITPYSTSLVWSVINDGNGNGSGGNPAYSQVVRPSYYLSSGIQILSGSGTELDPYIVS